MLIRFIVTLAVIALLAGCTTPTQNNPLGIADPNQVMEWIELGQGLSQGVVVAGTATENPYLLAWGAAAGAVLVVAGNIVGKGRKKNDGES